MTSRITLAVALAIAAFAGLATPASARWEGNGQWQQDNRWHGNNNNNNRYYGNQYRAPPVVYATPYNYGYRAPPVIYNSTPGITVQIR
jgi:hypothetical protein